MLGVGIIGISATRGWARESHAPAIQAAPGLRVAAVAGRDRSRAVAAAESIGDDVQAVTGIEELLRLPAVDVVAVTVPVADHEEVIRAALRAGKHVVSEWPLTPREDQTTELAAEARARAVHTAVGLQARCNLAVARAGALLAEGAIGRVLSASVLSTTAGFGATVGAHDTYLEDPAAGMNLLTIQGAHTLDLVEHLLGPWASLSAVLSTLHPRPLVEDGGARVDRSLPDHVLVHGLVHGLVNADTAAAGVPVTVEVAGGRPPGDSPFTLEVVGERSTLVLTGGTARGFQAGVLSLSVDGQPVALAVPDWQVSLPASAQNVAGLYATLAEDVAAGTVRTPSFDDAARLARLVDAVRRAGADGTRQDLHR